MLWLMAWHIFFLQQRIAGKFVVVCEINCIAPRGHARAFTSIKVKYNTLCLQANVYLKLLAALKDIMFIEEPIVLMKISPVDPIDPLGELHLSALLLMLIYSRDCVKKASKEWGWLRGQWHAQLFVCCVIMWRTNDLSHCLFCCPPLCLCPFSHSTLIPTKDPLRQVNSLGGYLWKCLASIWMGKHQVLQNCSPNLRLNFIFEITN